MPRLLLSALLLIGLLLSVPFDGGLAHAEDELQVVTTLGILAEIAAEVGGDRVTTRSLVAPDEDPHFVRPRPTLMKHCRNADVFVEVGMQLELWVDRVVDGAGNARIYRGQPGRVVASRGVRALEIPARASRDLGDVHPSGNPHVWLDPLNLKIMARNISRALAHVDPVHADDYGQRLEAFEQRVDVALFGSALVDQVGGRKLTREARRGRLHEYLESNSLTEKLGGWLGRASALRGKKLVTYHRNWTYFGARFGLEIPVEIEEKPGIPPSARHRDAVLKLVRERKVQAVIVTTYYPTTAADYLAERSEATVVHVPIDIGERVELTSYFSLMDHVLDELLKAYKN